jgi:predicted nucleic acid-binding protein
VDAFDADVLIYAAEPGHPFGQRVLPLLPIEADGTAVGSTLLLPEILIEPRRASVELEHDQRSRIVDRLVLHPLDVGVAQVAVTIGATYGLRAPDAIHLATAIHVGADRFITNNRRDFPKSIEEIEIVYPDDLLDPPET